MTSKAPVPTKKPETKVATKSTRMSAKVDNSQDKAEARVAGVAPVSQTTDAEALAAIDTSGYVLPEYLAWAASPKGEAWPPVVSSSALYTSLLIRMRERGQRPMPNETGVALALNKLVGVQLKRQQRSYANPLEDGAPPEAMRLPDRMSSIINLPPLDECRKAFCTYVGQGIEWPDDGPAEPKVKEKF